MTFYFLQTKNVQTSGGGQWPAEPSYLGQVQTKKINWKLVNCVLTSTNPYSLYSSPTFPYFLSSSAKGQFFTTSLRKIPIYRQAFLFVSFPRPFSPSEKSLVRMVSDCLLARESFRNSKSRHYSTLLSLLYIYIFSFWLNILAEA